MTPKLTKNVISLADFNTI